MHDLLEDVALAFEEREVRVGEVVLASVGWGEWSVLQREVERGIASQRLADRDGAGVTDAELRPSLVAWRRARSLLSGEEYLAWLNERSISTDDVTAHLTRSLLRERGADASREEVDPGELAAAMRVEVLLGGQLREWAQRLSRQFAAARGLDADGALPPSGAVASRRRFLADAARALPATGLPAVPEQRLSGWADDVAMLEEAWQAFCERAADERRIERTLADHALDWQRLSWEEVTFPREDAAREAVLWVRDDGMTLRELAHHAGVACTTQSALGDQAGELGTLLLGARVGELLGPVPVDGGWRLVQLSARATPSADDDALCERARAEVLHDALARHLAGRVQWRGHL